MGRTFASIPSDHQQWALRQSIFFIASAPLDGKHINCSPKGQPSSTLTILNDNSVGYLDATGSGVETISHVYENGRATIMFCSFDKSPKIMRWYCRGRVIEVDHPEYETWLKTMGRAEYPSMRAIILFDVFKVTTSCGYAVPLLSYRVDPEDGTRGAFQERRTLESLATKCLADPAGMDAYRAQHNSRSLDGCPGLRKALKNNKQDIRLVSMLRWTKRISRQWEAMLVGAFLTLMIMALLRLASRQLVLYTDVEARYQGTL